jgi:hypothetical protein
MGLFGFLRRKDERASPEPGTPEFDAAVRGSAIPDPQSVSMGESGWTAPDSSQTVDASTVPGLQEKIFRALGESGVQIPGAGGFGGGISPPPQDPLDQIEHLASRREAGEISDAEFEAQKRRLLGE